MFDLTSSKLLILGVVALIVVGPKELPFLLRTIGKYMAMIRRQANEFRAQFDEAMREAELEGIKKDLETVARDTENTIRSAQTDVERDIHATTSEIDRSLQQSPQSTAEPVHTHDPVNGLDTSAGFDASAPAPVDATHVAVAVPEPTTITHPASEPAPSELAKTGT